MRLLAGVQSSEIVPQIAPETPQLGQMLGSGQCLPSQGAPGQHGQPERDGHCSSLEWDECCSACFALVHPQHRFGFSEGDAGVALAGASNETTARLSCVFKRKYATKVSAATSRRQTRGIY